MRVQKLHAWAKSILDMTIKCNCCCYLVFKDNYDFDSHICLGCKSKLIICYCGDWTCDYNCGTLWCGCTDVCRGRCGFKDNIGYSNYYG